MHQKHSNAIKQSSVRSNRTHKNIEILKKYGFRELIFNSVWFGSVGKKSSRVKLYVDSEKNNNIREKIIF